MTTFAGGSIEAFVGPRELGAPDNLESVIVEFIGKAKSSLDIAVREIDNPRVAEAIVNASWRGVELFLQQDYLRTPLKEIRRSCPAPARGDTRAGLTPGAVARG